MCNLIAATYVYHDRRQTVTWCANAGTHSHSLVRNALRSTLLPVRNVEYSIDLLIGSREAS